jgi:hypothetical protein
MYIIEVQIGFVGRGLAYELLTLHYRVKAVVAHIGHCTFER